jgi:hypothetical protein
MVELATWCLHSSSTWWFAVRFRTAATARATQSPTTSDETKIPKILRLSNRPQPCSKKQLLNRRSNSKRKTIGTKTMPASTPRRVANLCMKFRHWANHALLGSDVVSPSCPWDLTTKFSGRARPLKHALYARPVRCNAELGGTLRKYSRRPSASMKNTRSDSKVMTFR